MQKDSGDAWSDTRMRILSGGVSQVCWHKEIVDFAGGSRDMSVTDSEEDWRD